MDAELYQKLCRLCLEKPEGEFNWLDDSQTRQELSEAFPEIQVDTEIPALSKIICQNCMNLIRKIIEFKQRIRKNQEFLLNLIKDDNEKLVEGEAGKFLEVFLDSKEILKDECQIKVSCDTGQIERKTEENYQNSRINVDDATENDPISPPAQFEGESDDDTISEKSSLSEDDYARKDPSTEHKSNLLPLPQLEYEKNTNYVWCPFCYEKFKHKYFLASHGKSHHPEYNWAFRPVKSTRTKWTCKFCDKVYSRRFRLKEHALVVHFGHQPYQCDICGFTSNLKNGLRNHIEGRHLKRRFGKTRERETIVCNICNFVCISKDSHYNHMKSHENSEERPFKCMKCDLHFKKQRTLDKHNRSVHITEDLPFTCNLCISARFVTEEILKLHLKRHECSEEKSAKQPFACTACELRFCNKVLLDNHVKHHEKNEIDSCQICGKTLYRSSATDHMEKHKTKYEEFKNVCDQCGRRFRVEWCLLKHLKTHDKPEFYECDKCGKRIKKKFNFVTHIQKCTGPIKEWNCTFCDLKFPTKQTKYKHEKKVHTGWSCKRCNLPFNRYQELKMHRRTVEHKKLGKWGKLQLGIIAEK
uniref:CSON014938 protein n=1 Tax=Culicoides sonorensis TaxID=179676 RepID=A0A336KRY9_CULSO